MKPDAKKFRLPPYLGIFPKYNYLPETDEERELNRLSQELVSYMRSGEYTSEQGLRTVSESSLSSKFRQAYERSIEKEKLKAIFNLSLGMAFLVAEKKFKLEGMEDLLVGIASFYNFFRGAGRAACSYFASRKIKDVFSQDR